MSLTESGTERRFQLLVEAVSDYAIYMLSPEGRIMSWNAGGRRIKGYDTDEVIGKHFSLFYTPEDRRVGLPARALEHATKEGRYEAEGWRVRKNGERFWASVIIDAIHDEHGKHVGFAKITRDISEKKIQQEALEQSERQFRLLVAGVVDYALYMLDPNGIITNWNAGGQQIKGYSADEIVGQHFSRFYTDQDRASGLPTRALQTARDQGRYEAEGWRVRKDGSLFWASVVIDAIRDEQDNLIGFAKITRDITERRNAQLELQKANERLAQAQKMEAMGQLTGGVAHDFNNLMMVVGGQAELLRRHLEGDTRAQRALDAIDIAARRGQELTRHLLTFARRQRLNPVTISLHERAKALKELLSTSAGSPVAVHTDLPEDLWPVQADLGEFELALINLTVNARDAMPNGGAFSITGQNVSLKGGEIDPELKGDFVALSAHDTGVGIPADILPRVFEPFFTTKEVSKGTGLGLSQVYGFAQQTGGYVQIVSELGVGTTITLYLPRSRHEPNADTQEAPPTAAPRNASILVVEDNPEVAEVTAALLEQLGNRTRVVTSAAAALKVLDEGDLPDLVLSDIVMAGELDGIGLARKLRDEHPDLPVLLATGYSQAAERLSDEFPILAKPYQVTDLSQAVGALLERRDQATRGKLVELESARRKRERG
ncbi:MAG: PAS domain S-box protein [Parcubacteria group bacterium]